MAEIERAMLGDDIVAVVVVGELDLADEARVDLAIDFVVRLEIPRVLLDLTRCEFVDATGLRILLQAHDRVHRSGARLAVAGPMARVRRVFEMTGIGERLSLFDSRELALASLA